MRWAVLLVMLSAVYPAWRWGPSAWRRAAFLHRQQQCLTYGAPADQVVYDGHPDSAAELLSRDGWSREGATSKPVAVRPADCWTAFQPDIPPLWPAGSGYAAGGVIFCHERRAPDGFVALVALTAKTQIHWPGNADVGLQGIVVERGGLFKAPRLHNPGTWDFADLRLYGARRTYPDLEDVPNHPRPPFMRTNQVRFFAAQADPVDTSRFTFRYEMNGGAGTIEGRLMQATEKSGPGPHPRYYVHLNMLDGPGLEDPALPPTTRPAPSRSARSAG